MGRFSVYSCEQIAVVQSVNSCVQGSNFSLKLLFNSKLDRRFNGVKLEITRKVGGSENMTCHMYVVAHALMEVMNSDLKSILY